MKSIISYWEASEWNKPQLPPRPSLAGHIHSLYFPEEGMVERFLLGIRNPWEEDSYVPTRV